MSIFTFVYMPMVRLFLIPIFTLCIALSMQGQSILESGEHKDTTRAQKIIIQNANSQKLDASTDTTLQYLQGNVRLLYDSVYFYCDTAIITDYLFIASGNVSIIKRDYLKIFADSLRYFPDSSKVYFYGEKDGNVVLENIDNQLFTNYLIYDMDRDIAMYTDRGMLITPESKVKSQRGFFHVRSKYVNFYDNVEVTGKDFDIQTDSLRYYQESKRAKFLAPVVINQKNKRIYSESGYYDMADDRGEFIGNAQFIEGENTSTADKISHDGKLEVTSLLGNAKYRSSEESGEADSIYYDQKEEKVRLVGNGIFRNQENEVTGDVILYDKKTEAMNVIGRSFLSKPPFLITADKLNYIKETGRALADGDVIWQDTSSDYTIYADHIRYKKEKSYLKAYNDTGKPLLENQLNDTDTLYLSGDTLVAYQEVYEVGDTQKVLLSYANVEVLIDDLQAVCDSLSFIERDSQFVLYERPILWSDSTQFSADTVTIIMKNEAIDKVLLNENTVIISTEDMAIFNQVAGRNAVAYFVSKKLNKLDVVGEAKSVYYLADEGKAYLGANETNCRRIIFIFEEDELAFVKFYDENTHKLTPMDQVKHGSIRVEGYNWNLDLRPLTINDLKQ